MALVGTTLGLLSVGCDSNDTSRASIYYCPPDCTCHLLDNEIGARMKYEIELEDEQISKIICDEITWCVNLLKKDLAARKAGSTLGIFHKNPKKDCKKIKKHIKAFKTVFKYYSIPN